MEELRRTAQIPVFVSPALPGCGFVEQAEADIAAGKTLIEVKSVGRTFRGADVRQVLVYAAPDEAGGRPYGFAEMALLNPRQGTALTWNIDDLCVAVSGAPRSEVLPMIIAEMSLVPTTCED